MTIQEKIRVIKDYKELEKEIRSCYSITARLSFYKWCERLGVEPEKGRIFGKYPSFSNSIFCIGQFYFYEDGYTLTNRTTKTSTKNRPVIVWRESCGRLNYVEQDMWYEIEDEWNEFKKSLIEIGCIDYDLINNTIVYDVEHGKIALEKFPEIEEKFKKAIKEKEINVEKARKLEQLKKLQEELGV